MDGIPAAGYRILRPDPDFRCPFCGTLLEVLVLAPRDVLGGEWLGDFSQVTFLVICPGCRCEAVFEYGGVGPGHEYRD
jgi:hypothetical protein